MLLISIIVLIVALAAMIFYLKKEDKKDRLHIIPKISAGITALAIFLPVALPTYNV